MRGKAWINTGTWLQSCWDASTSCTSSHTQRTAKAPSLLSYLRRKAALGISRGPLTADPAATPGQGQPALPASLLMQDVRYLTQRPPLGIKAPFVPGSWNAERQSSEGNGRASRYRSRAGGAVGRGPSDSRIAGVSNSCGYFWFLLFFFKLIYLKSHPSCAKKTPEGKKEKRESPTAFFTRSQMNTDIST